MHSVRAQPFRFLGPLILAGLLLASSAALAAGESLQDLFQAERFDEVIERGQIATGQDGGDGEAWFFLGRALLQTGKYKKAQEALAHAVEQSFRPAYSRFHLAVAAAHRKRTAEALEALDAAVKAGFLQVEGLEDPAFDGFRTSRQFLDIAERQKAQAMPCLYDDRYRQWDFWLGNWNVLGVDGSPQGRNTIQLTENGCALIETWTSASGGSGTSVNYFDPKTSKWNQIWVDSRGGNIRLVGSYHEGTMALQGAHVTPDGKSELIRGSWRELSDGRVRQFFEQSKDVGKTWYVWFEGFYNKTAEE